MSNKFITIKDFFDNKIKSVDELAKYKANSFSKSLILNNREIFDELFFNKSKDDNINFSKIFELLLKENDEFVAIFSLCAFLLPNLTVHGINEKGFSVVSKLFESNYEDKIYFTIQINKLGQRIVLDFYDCRESSETGTIISSSLFALSSSELFDLYNLSKLSTKFLNNLRLLQNQTQDIGIINCLMTMDKSYLLQDIVSLCYSDYVSRYPKLTHFAKDINDKLINRHTRYTFVLNGEQNKLLPDLSIAQVIFDKEEFIKRWCDKKIIKDFNFNPFSSIFENWNEKIYYRDSVFRENKFEAKLKG